MKNITQSILHRKVNTRGFIYNLGWFIFLTLQVISPVSSSSQNVNTPNYNIDSLFTGRQLNEDLVILRKALEEGHAGLYRYTPKEELDKMLEKIDRKLTEPMSEFDFFLELQPLIADINCGHTHDWGFQGMEMPP